MNIGEQIRKERNDCMLNRKQLADLSNISYNTIKAIENGSRNTSYNIVVKLLEAMDREIKIIPKNN